MTASLPAQPAPTVRTLEELGRSVGWILAAMFGLAVGGFVLHFPGSYGELTGWEVAPGVFGLVLGAVNGMVFGILLWLAAGGGWAVGRRLIVFGALAVGSTHGLHDASSVLTPYPIVAAVSGACVALAWWLAFRNRPPWHAAVAGVAWATGLLAASRERGARTALGADAGRVVDGPRRPRPDRGPRVGRRHRAPSTCHRRCDVASAATSVRPARLTHDR